MGQCYCVHFKAKIKDEAKFVRLSAERLKSSFGFFRIAADCFNGHDLTTPIGNIKFVLAANQRGFEAYTKDGWPFYRNEFDASYTWELVLGDWFHAVAPALEDGSEIVVWPDEGMWSYTVSEGEAA